MKILVACKIVPEEQDIAVNADQSLDLSKANPTINPFDLNALQCGVDIKNMQESIICVMSVGGQWLQNAKVKKDILSRGADELLLAQRDDFANLLPTDTAKILSNIAKQTGFDLIITGDGSGDLYLGQTALKLGKILNIAACNCVSKIVETTQEYIIVERSLENQIQTLKIPLPACISVSADINIPQIPGMKAIINASKKPVQDFDINLQKDDFVKTISTKAIASKTRKRLILEGDSDEKIEEFINQIKSVL